MRFEIKNPEEYLRARIGETRVRRKFLLIPRRFYKSPGIGVFEIRWLCWANVREMITPYIIYDGAYPTGTGYSWEEIGFED